MAERRAISPLCPVCGSIVTQVYNIPEVFPEEEAPVMCTHCGSALTLKWAPILAVEDE
jgi:DNA-directed RNA polymerase subunit RPC12/RpoP